MARRSGAAARLAVLVAAGLACSRGAQRSAPAAAAGWLTDVTARVGLDFVHASGASGRLELPEIMGAGVALFDADGDGDLDVYLTGGAAGDRLYRRRPDGGFDDGADGPGAPDAGTRMGVAVGDVDNDGDADLYLTNYGDDRLYLNRGDGSFVDGTAEAGIAVDGWSTSACFFDYDRDGLLDLYVARYVRYDPGKRCSDAAGRADYCAPDVFAPSPDVLLHNEGGGRFSDVSRPAGLGAVYGPGLGVACEDLDDDGWTDVYVANDGAANQLWVNQGDGTFRERALVEGVAYNLHGEPEAGMGVLAVDLDGDLDLDLFLTHLDGETDTVYRNRGRGHGFEDATGASGVGPPSLALTGFGTVAVDLELDGDLDLVVVNGRVTRGRAWPGSPARPPWDRLAQPNQVLLGDGAAFRPAGAAAAGFERVAEVSRGLAAGDVDGDGDIDLLIGNVEGPARLYVNEAPRSGDWLRVRARDPRYGRDAIGARVTVTRNGVRWRRTISTGGGYLSSSEPVAHFGLGRSSGPLEAEVRWPDGQAERFVVAGPDMTVTLVRGTGTWP